MLTRGIVSVLLAASTAAAPAGAQPIAVALTAGTAPTDDVALVMGGTGTPHPPPTYVDAADSVYLQPNGFDGITVPLPTKATFLDAEKVLSAETATLTAAIEAQIAAGHGGAGDPVYVFGYSGSAALPPEVMAALHADGVPSDAVHFVVIGSPVTPDGGWFTRFDIPPGSDAISPLNNTPLGHPLPNDLYPTDVYITEYDPVADFPRYPLNLLSDLNALIGLFYRHLAYMGLSAEQVAQAIPLDTAGHTLTDYYMIPSEYLPLLVPLALVPVIGKPLYDLLEPDARVLVNLGYGSIAHGWDPAPVNVETPISLAQPDVDLGAFLSALAGGFSAGVDAFAKDLVDPATYAITPLVDNPVLANLIATQAVYGGDPHPSSILEVLSVWVQTLFVTLTGGDGTDGSTDPIG